ncbi:dendritic cell-specific transmembrane protein [Discoglossus pictus]
MADFTMFMLVLSNTMNIFVLEREPGWKNTLYLCLLCLAFGLTTSGGLFLIFKLSLVFNYFVSLAIACLLGIIVSTILFFFKSVRCVSILFLLSCGMRQGRNVLLTAGTGIIVFFNVKNIFTNLKSMADSITCNLEAKRSSLRLMPFELYIQAVYWIFNQTKDFFNPYTDIISITDTLESNILINDDGLKFKLNETKQQIQNVTDNVSLVLQLGSHVGNLVLLLSGAILMLVGNGLFLKKFLDNNSNKFENSYITHRFVEFDGRRKQQNRASVFPLTKQEEKNYIRIPSLKITTREKKKMILYFIPVFANIFIWSLLSFVDFVLYWLIITLSKHIQQLSPIIVPMKVFFYDKTYKESLQINLFEPQCVPKAEAPLSEAWIPLGIIVLVLFMLGLLSAFLIQIKLLVTASFYPSKDSERTHYLHSKILRKRLKGAAHTGGQKLSAADFGLGMSLHSNESFITPVRNTGSLNCSISTVQIETSSKSPSTSGN